MITTLPYAVKNTSAQEMTINKSHLEYYVAENNLRVRSSPDDKSKILGFLNLNEKVKIIPATLVNAKYVQIEIPHTNKIFSADKYFVAKQYLSEKFIDYKDFTGKYYVVVNVATETLRIYERECFDHTCPSKMIMETEVVVGEDVDLPKEDKGKGRSILGSYRVTGWAKFYQDGAAHYPAWYRPGYPELPEPGTGFSKWLRKKFMPVNDNGEVDGEMRGAFGWYAAFVAPNPFAQWMHGTIGWGEDKDTHVKNTKKFITNIISNPRSSGCTRNNNEAIAYIRQLIDTGAPIIKIYAKEALYDQSLSNYDEKFKEWNYILTKKAGEKSDREDTLKALKLSGKEADHYWNLKRHGGEILVDPSSPLNQILEVGTYKVDTYPTPIKFTPGEKMGKLERALGRKGNVYGLKNRDMAPGVFLVDAGLLKDYHHPAKVLEVSGFLDEENPQWMDYKYLEI